jgi:large subunit ribosomal protein L18
MKKSIGTYTGRERRRRRIRAKISGTTERPRLAVFRSLSHIYAQIIDDTAGQTLAAASTVEQSLREGANGRTKTEEAKLVGELVAKRALEKDIKQVVFDRAGYLYHGRVKAVAEGARAGGLEF